jgi:hypothetical protein
VLTIRVAYRHISPNQPTQHQAKLIANRNNICDRLFCGIPGLPSDFDGRDSLNAFPACNGISASLIRTTDPTGTLSDIETGPLSGPQSLIAQLRVSNVGRPSRPI